MGLSREDALKMHAKRRIKKGKPKPGDYQLAGIEKPESGENPKADFKKVEPVKSEPKPQTGEFKQVENPQGYSENTLDSFISTANKYGKSPFEENAGFDSPEIQSLNLSEDEKLSGKEKLQIKGYMILVFIDMAAPHLIVYLSKRFLKQKVSADDLKLTPEQIKENEEMADALAERLGMGFDDPAIALTIGLTICYAGNFMNAEKEKIEK